MIITTTMAKAKGMVDQQSEIMDALGGELNTDNFSAVLAAAVAGLDLMWLARKFITTYDITNLKKTISEINQAVEKAKADAADTFSKAKIAMIPPVFAPEATLNETVEPIEQTLRAIPEATAFSIAFAGEG